MKTDTLLYIRGKIRDFFEGALNLFLFFPYFFSVSALFKTLFYPWKNIVAAKTGRGFSFGELFERIFFNAVSSAIGFIMRMSIILFYVLLQTLYVILLPFIIIAFFLSLPAYAIRYQYEKTPEEQRARRKKAFMDTHLLKEENQSAVEAWFMSYYDEHLKQKEWWKLENLLTYPPLGRDWAMGYTPLLDEYATELTSVSYQGNIQDIVGRNSEIDDLQEVLIKNNEANAVIVGEEGVGKHTIVDALAKKIYEGRSLALLAYKRILKLNFEKILTRYTDMSQRENFIEELFSEAVAAKNVILLIENLDKYVASGPDRVDLTIPIENFGKNGALQFIGITSPFFYQKFVFGNEKINRMFTKIDVGEISAEEAKKTLMETAYAFEQRNNVVVPYETVVNTVEKSEFYITHIPFPEKAFDLLDLAGAYCRRTLKANGKKGTAVIMPDMIDAVLSEKTHIPTRLTDEMRTKLVDLEKLLNSQVLHQEDAVAKLSASMRRSFILLGKRKKPIGSFLFLGPTGVGKTETAKALAHIFFGSEKYLLRFDMSLYQTIEDIKTLIGSIDTGTPGLLSKAIRETPYGVLLLDEIEKADKDLLNIFLTLTDEGYFTDGFGKRVDCKNLIVIATSNAGADFIFKQEAVMDRLQPYADAPEKRHRDLVSYLVSERLFSPEFLNRFDGVVMYRTVTKESVMALTRKMVEQIGEDLHKLYKIRVTVSEETLKNLTDKGYDPQFGARNLQRVITEELEDRIAKLILEKQVHEGDTVSI